MQQRNTSHIIFFSLWSLEYRQENLQKKFYEKTVFKKKKNISNKEQKAPQNPPNDHPPFTIVVQKYTKVKKFFFIIKHTLERLMPQRVHSLIFPFFPVQTRLHSFTFTQCNYYNMVITANISSAEGRIVS